MFHFNVDLKALRLLADLQVSGKFVPGSGCIDTKCCLTLFTCDSQESRVTKKGELLGKTLGLLTQLRCQCVRQCVTWLLLCPQVRNRKCLLLFFDCVLRIRLDVFGSPTLHISVNSARLQDRLRGPPQHTRTRPPPPGPAVFAPLGE